MHWAVHVLSPCIASLNTSHHCLSCFSNSYVYFVLCFLLIRVNSVWFVFLLVLMLLFAVHSHFARFFSQLQAAFLRPFAPGCMQMYGTAKSMQMAKLSYENMWPDSWLLRHRMSWRLVGCARWKWLLNDACWVNDKQRVTVLIVNHGQNIGILKSNKAR